MSPCQLFKSRQLSKPTLLAKYPASTLQILGAEKALFRSHPGHRASRALCCRARHSWTLEMVEEEASWKSFADAGFGGLGIVSRYLPLGLCRGLARSSVYWVDISLLALRTCM
ncbi:hypothetical protein V2G26_009389 [Clonostachys chloroleuca]